ncbi:timeless protein-domain-containing protein [Blastocladiella britannica]|nr:timeless protein-domain-containing protein [Blastocladiella britannica]
MSDAENERPQLDAEAQAALHNHLLSLVQALGGNEDVIGPDGVTPTQQFVLGVEALDCLRDIKRFLRYDESHQEKLVQLKLGQLPLMQSALIPIILYHSANQPIFFAAVELLVPLTWPLSPDQLRTDLIRHQRATKHVIVELGVLELVFEQLLLLIATPFRERTERVNAMIRLILYFFRNLLAIPDMALGSAATSESLDVSNMQTRLLTQLHDLDVLEFFIAAASNVAERQYSNWNTILAELFFLILSSVDPRQLADPKPNSTKSVLERFHEQESLQKVVPRKRHSRFYGTFAVQVQEETRFLVHDHTKTIDALDDNKHKHRLRKRKPAQMAPTTALELHFAALQMKAPTADAIKVLRPLADSFLEMGFEPLLLSCKRDIDAERSHVRDEDPIHALFLMRFFFEYQRVHPTHPVTHLSALANVHGLLFITKHMRLSLEEGQLARLEITIVTFHSFLLLVQSMMQSSSVEIRDLATNILENLLYEKSHLDTLVMATKHPYPSHPAYLASLVQLVHLVFKLMEHFVKAQGKDTLTVRQAKRSRTAATGRGKDVEEEELVARDVDAEPSSVHDQGGDAGDARPAFVERDLTIARIEAMFASDAVVEKYLSVLRRGVSGLDAPTVHAVAKMFYRIAVRCHGAALFFQLDYLVLLNQLLSTNDSGCRHSAPQQQQQQSSTNPGESASHQLLAVIRVILAKLFESFERYPLLLVDLFYPHAKRDVLRLTTGHEEPSRDRLRASTAGASGGAAVPRWDNSDELQVRKGFSSKMQVQLATGALLLRNDSDMATGLGRILATMAALAQMRKHADDDDSTGVADAALSIPDEDMAIPEMRLLLRLIGFLVTPVPAPDGDSDTTWSVIAPGSLEAAEIEDAIAWIMEAQASPVRHEGKPATRFLKIKRKRTTRRSRAPPRPESGDADSGVGKQSKAASAKSTAFIYDSDELLEGTNDAEFYEQELARRDRIRTVYTAAVPDVPPPTKKKALPKPRSSRVTPPSRTSIGSEPEADSDTDSDADAGLGDDDDDDGAAAISAGSSDPSANAIDARLAAMRNKLGASRSVVAPRRRFLLDSDSSSGSDDGVEEENGEPSAKRARIDAVM